MSDAIRLVQLDTAPIVYVSLTDPVTDLPINLVGCTVVMQYFPLGGAVTDTLTGTLLAGLVNCDGTITIPGYTTPGSGGRVSFAWNSLSLANYGQFAGQVVITFPDTTVQTLYDLIRFNVRSRT